MAPPEIHRSRPRGTVLAIVGAVLIVIGVVSGIVIAIVNSNTPLQGTGTPDGLLQGLWDVATALCIGVGAALLIVGLITRRRPRR